MPRFIQLSPGGLLNLNVAEHRLKMTPELYGQSKWHLWLLPCCRKAGDGRPTTESPGDSHRSGHFIWQRLEYFAWTFGFKQGPCQMGPMFSDIRSEVLSDGNMFGVVGYLQCNLGQRVVPYNNWWWNMDSPLGLRHHPRVDAEDTRQLSSAQEVPHSTVGWKVMATIIWDCKGVLLMDYLPQKTTMTGPYTVKCWQICVRQWRRSGGGCWPEVRRCCTIMLRRMSQVTGHSQGHRVWADVSSTLLTRHDTQRLLLISTSEAAPSRNAVFRWRWAVAGHGVVFQQHTST